MVDAYMSIGSNLGDRLDNLRRGLRAIALLPGVSVEKVSSIYETEPVGIVDQPMFLNAVIKIVTRLRPRQLLTELQAIEVKLGRLRTQRLRPRVLDIDILLYSNLVYSDSELEIPHPQLRARRFVLVPLAQISPDLVLPGDESISVIRLLSKCPDRSKVQLFSRPERVEQSNIGSVL